MSKTFKSVALPNVSVSIKQSSDGVRICSVHGPDVANMTVAPSDAPALALAILEAAGESPLGEARWVTDAKYALGEIATFRANKEAEAKDKAELEAEALELMNVRLRASGAAVHLTKATADPVALGMWIAVARRAREMRAEK